MIYLELSTAEARRLEALAADAGLPTQLWLTLAIEARRSLIEATHVTDIDSGALALTLDQMATEAGQGSATPGEERIAAYARALKQAEPRTPRSRISRLSVRPALAIVLKWSESAARSRLELEPWLQQAAGEVRDARVSWEAAAASCGQALSEWMLQAALRIRVRSVAAQTRAN